MGKRYALLVAIILFLFYVEVCANQIVLHDYYDYIIITTEEISTGNALTDFLEWKESLGFSTKVVTTSWITSNYEDLDIQEKIRNFLIDKQMEWNINYVLIVGSEETIPMRTCYINPFDHNDEYSIITTDYYYADLTGDWDSDNDDYFGEYLQDDVDFYPEIYVGRIPFDDVDIVKNVCQKIINFEKDDNRTWKKSALLIGAVIYYENYVNEWGTWHRVDGSVLMERCWNDILSPFNFTATRLYEKEGLKPAIYPCDRILNCSNVLSEWEKHGIINIMAHSTSSYVCRCIWVRDDGDNVPENNELSFPTILKATDAEKLSMHTPPVVFSGGCRQLAGDNNMGKTFIREGAASAYIGSTTYSWINKSLRWENEKDGGTLSLDYYFFNFFINNKQKLGNALYNAKVQYYLHFVQPFVLQDKYIPLFYANMYGFNLYGDPAMGLINEKMDSKPPSISIDKPRNYLYLFNKEIFPTGKCAIIIGGITVSVSASDENGIQKVVFYLDTKIKEETIEKPYQWNLKGIIGVHTLRIAAYDTSGNIAGDEINILILSI